MGDFLKELFIDEVKGCLSTDGQDGYTPIKGIDYFTEAEKAEMVQAVIAALPTAEGGAY